ncbi:UNVERIFIED_CONTAM: hypothetical protein Sindi_2251600 [Sesamum indicum]
MEKKILEQQSLIESMRSDVLKVKELTLKLESAEKELEEVKSSAQSDNISAFESGREQGLAEGREQGLIKGRDIYLQSSDQQNLLVQTRFGRACDFLRSRTFKEAIENQAVEFPFEGFEKCHGQIKKLGGLVQDFDLEQLDISIDKNMEPFPPVHQQNDEFPEFAPLMDDLPSPPHP